MNSESNVKAVFFFFWFSRLRLVSVVCVYFKFVSGGTEVWVEFLLEEFKLVARVVISEEEGVGVIEVFRVSVVD